MKYSNIVLCRTEHCFIDIPSDEPRKKIHECMADIASKWAALTQEERSAITLDRVKALSLGRENREIGHHNVPLAAFHDTCLTYTDVVEAVSKQDIPLN